MDGDTPPERDVAGDGLRAQRRTAARERGRQVTHTFDVHRRGAAPCRGGSRRSSDALGHRRLEQPRRGVHELRNRDLTLAEQLMQVIHIARAQFAGEGRELLRPGADACELDLRELRAGAAVGADVLLAEPGADLAAVARGGEVALLGREP